MNSFELNKIVAAILIALLGAMLATLIAEQMIKPVQRLKQNSYIVAVADAEHVQEKKDVEKIFEPIAEKLASANLSNGEKVFKKCIQCHSLEQGKNNIGPSLWGVFGKAIASVANFAYSSALKEKATEKWDAEHLNKFLYSPKKYAKGTKMTFLGIENDQDRIDVIAYLQKHQ